MVEFRADDTGVAVWSSDFAPDDSDLAALSLLRCSVNVCDTLSEIKSVVCGQYAGRFSGRRWRFRTVLTADLRRPQS